MGDNVVQLASKSHHENILGSLHQLMLGGHLSDITVQVDHEGQLEEFQAHQVMLAASSGYFKRVLLSEEGVPDKLFISNIKLTDFSRFLEFVYTGRVEMVRDEITEVRKAAEILECKDLSDICGEAIDVRENPPETTCDDPGEAELCDDDTQVPLGPRCSLASGREGKRQARVRGAKRQRRAASRMSERRRKKRRKEQQTDEGEEADLPAGGRRGRWGPGRRAVKVRLTGGRGPSAAPGPEEPGDIGEYILAEDTQEEGLGEEIEALPSEAQASDVVHDEDDDDEDGIRTNVDVPEMEDSDDPLYQEEINGKGGNYRRSSKRSFTAEFHCEKCLRTFYYERSFLKHISTYHGAKTDITYRCETCEQTFANRSNLKIHEKHVHTDERLFTCRVCPKTFKRKKDVVRHQRQVHEGDHRQSHVCPDCGKVLSSKSAMKLHERTHTGDKPYQCDVCMARFSQRPALKTHQRIHTGEKPFACDLCDARFIQKHMLTYHMRSHTGEKPYMCECCGKSFASKEYLKHHANIHSGAKPYRCQLCGRCFAQRNSLQQHMKTHTGERPYHCKDCDKQFTQLNALQRHQRIHTGEKPYMCGLCHRTFTDKSTVRRHTMTHDTETPWKNYLVVLSGNVEEKKPKGKINRSGGKGKVDAEVDAEVEDQVDAEVEDQVDAEVDAQADVHPEAHMEAQAGAHTEAHTEAQAGALTEDLTEALTEVEVKAEALMVPVTVAGDWASHGTIALVSHTDLASLTVIHAEGVQLQHGDAEAVISIDGSALSMPYAIAQPVAVSEAGPPASISDSHRAPAVPTTSVLEAAVQQTLLGPGLGAEGEEEVEVEEEVHTALA